MVVSMGKKTKMPGLRRNTDNCLKTLQPPCKQPPDNNNDNNDSNNNINSNSNSNDGAILLVLVKTMMTLCRPYSHSPAIWQSSQQL